MSGAPNREWQPGNCGPDYHMETRRKKRHGNLWARPNAAENWRCVPLDPRAQPQRTGRDPHDTVTRELPGIEPPIPDDIVTRVAAGLYGEGDDVIDDEVPWLVLLLKSEADWEAADAGDIRMRHRLGWSA